MIVYDLVCKEGHDFEGWFDDAADYERQRCEGTLQCPVCGTPEVRRVPSASHLSLKGGGDKPEDERRRRQALVERFQEHVERHYEDVGDRFAEEARKMHYGESEPRNIRGAANWSEFKALRQEGIAVVPLPVQPVAKDKLN